jgi:hypothetical protein
MLWQTVAASRNLVYWDEFDTALALLLRLDDGAGWRELWARIFELSNEHRTVTSRVLFAAGYWLTGTVNFHVVGAIGNLFIVGACALLLWQAGTRERRVRLGVLLAFLLFQMGNFENFFWSGASIDHFQVVMLAIGAFIGLVRATRTGFAAAGTLAVLATFTLAHGVVVWPVGAALLGQQRRWTALAAWGGLAALAAAAFFQGFDFNPAHRIESADPLGVAVYWLALLGAPLAFGATPAAPWCGVGLLAGLGFFAARGALARERTLMATAVFAIVALALIAYGRAALSEGQIASRYLVLGSLAWAVLGFLLVEPVAETPRPYFRLLVALPLLAVFNVAAGVRFARAAEDFLEARDRAALRFKQYGVDGRGQTRLHPIDGHAERVLGAAGRRGIYSLPSLCPEVRIPDRRPSTRMICHLDELMVTEGAISLGGWAMVPGRATKRGEIHVVLESASGTRIFRAITVRRDDVAKAFEEPRWQHCGFRLVVRLDRLPKENFRVGLMIVENGRGEYHFTEERLRLDVADPRFTLRFNTL